MAKTKTKYGQKTGELPGTPIYTGVLDFEPVIERICYNDTSFERVKLEHLSDFNPDPEKGRYWLHVKGLSQADEFSKLGVKLNLHPLLIEDILNTSIQPKVEEFDNCVLVILKYLIPTDEDLPVAEQISFVLTSNYVLSFQEIDKPFFDHICMALSNNSGKIRNKGSDYLFTLLMDHVVDSYLPEVDKSEQMLVEMEDYLMNDNNNVDVRDIILRNRKRYQSLKKIVIPLKETNSRLLRLDNELIHHSTKAYLRDVFDHIDFVFQSLDSYHEMLISLMNIGMSNNDLRMNQLMQRLTVVSTVFIPLSLLAGIWGMNFDIMPELRWQYGYLVAWGLMLLVGISIWVYLRKRIIK